ncbi:DUF4270 domain-containing protein [Bacteroides pyogenes]|uniref:DUF4270 domain-containing protein n=1 Tax=Bacteroides pyogenes TaxID=310300 RepID=UPI001F26B2FA|nr:DUF4270 domain-containing protein [Bacteroides pyogenes]MCF2708380.1 DUF4270 domain-containing protein [Bacteroides pyogenes]
MKAKYALIALLAITFFGCDDNTGSLGLGMFPGIDQNIKGKLSTFNVITESVATGKMYAKTNVGYVGKFTDKDFGTYKAGFLAELNCPEGMTFPEVYTEYDANGKPAAESGQNAVKATGKMIGTAAEDIDLIKDEQGRAIGNIHAVEIYLWYKSYFGDSLTACRLSVYELNKKLDKDKSYYTDIKPENYYREEDLLGTKAYTALDLSVKDSQRKQSNYIPSVHISFTKDIARKVGGEILKKSRAYGNKLNNKTFNEAFKGIYVNSDYGDGTVLYVDQSQMNVVYKCYATDSISGLKLKKKNGQDSTYYAYRIFASTREVIQANQLSNDEGAIEQRIKETDCTYLKSPAGILTQAKLPIAEIEKQLKNDTLNAVKMTFANYNQSGNKKNGMSIPSNVLLIRKQFKDSFFEKNELNDGISSFLTSHSAASNQYTFNNITKLVKACIAEKEAARAKEGTAWDETKWLENNADWDKVLLIPVLITYDSSSSGYNNAPKVISIQHDLKPGYVRLKGGKLGETNVAHRLKLEVISTDFKVAN